MEVQPSSATLDVARGYHATIFLNTKGHHLGALPWLENPASCENLGVVSQEGIVSQHAFQLFSATQAVSAVHDSIPFNGRCCNSSQILAWKSKVKCSPMAENSIDFSSVKFGGEDPNYSRHSAGEAAFRAEI